MTNNKTKFFNLSTASMYRHVSVKLSKTYMLLSESLEFWTLI